MISTPIIMKENAVIISTIKRDKSGIWDGYIELILKTACASYSVAGTVFSDGKLRFIKIQGIDFDADIGNSMIYIVNEDVPGMVGFVGNVLGKDGINIAHFHLGRSKLKEDAVSLLCVDGCVSSEILEELSSHSAIRSIKQFEFNVE
ncbi:hypothetical protein LSO9J_120002 [Candidatus Liberibacter solanacearum]